MIQFIKKVIRPNNYIFRNTSLEDDVSELAAENPSASFYIDTCSLIHNDGLRLLDALVDENADVCIFSSVINELYKLGETDPTKKLITSAALNKIAFYENEKKIRIILGYDNHFSDVNFISKFIHEITQRNIVFITQDRSLANTILSLTDFISPCVSTNNTVTVKKLSKNQGLCDFTDNFKEELKNAKLCTVQKPESASALRFYPYTSDSHR